MQSTVLRNAACVLALLFSSQSATAATRSANAGAASSKKAKPTQPAALPGASAAASSGSGMVLRGDQDGTAFQSLTVQGEDRVHIEFERPSLDLDLDLARAPGLDWGNARDVLERTQPDLVAPFMAQSSFTPCPYLGRPWLQQLTSGPVASFRPQVESVERWRLVVANSHGETVVSFSGQGRPPREIGWDGRSQTGQPVKAGLTYSYVLEAFDRAGNKRNFVGQGFEISAYRLQSPKGPILAFTGRDLSATAASGGFSPTSRSPQTSPLLLEAASWLDQIPQLQTPIRITATARSFEQANALASGVSRAIAPALLGNPARLQVQALVAPDACESGTIEIAPAP